MSSVKEALIVLTNFLSVIKYHFSQVFYASRSQALPIQFVKISYK